MYIKNVQNGKRIYVAVCLPNHMNFHYTESLHSRSKDFIGGMNSKTSFKVLSCAVVHLPFMNHYNCATLIFQGVNDICFQYIIDDLVGKRS